MQPTYRFTFNIPILKAAIDSHGLDFVLSQLRESVEDSVREIANLSVTDLNQQFEVTDGYTSLDQLRGPR
jgi:hypothetical protein